MRVAGFARLKSGMISRYLRGFLQEGREADRTYQFIRSIMYLSRVMAVSFCRQEVASENPGNRNACIRDPHVDRSPPLCMSCRVDDGIQLPRS